MEFTITSEQILWLCGFIATIYGVYKIIKELKKPSDDLKAMVQLHDDLLKKDNERLSEVENSNKMILQCLLILINHDITGNGIDRMKEARDELEEYLINK
ncbi:MAG: CTP synthase [Lachnospiraceae bacterium]|nr:CTP synthase [Lachnospiraceae bacterium]